MKAIYAFSGDPITYGHIDIVSRAACTYDAVVVAIGDNPAKVGRYLFSKAERLALSERCLSGMDRVTCVGFQGLLAEYAYRNQFDVIVRGVRNNSDLEGELIQFAVNESLHPILDTVFFPARGRLAHISSGVVKAIVRECGDVSAYCPLAVKEALEKKILGRLAVGVAGGIAAGKTFVAERLAEALAERSVTACYISLDSVGHYVLGPSEEHIYRQTRRRIGETFGDAVIRDDGTVDRHRLGRIVFNDAEALAELDRLMREPMLAKLYERTRNLPKGVVLLLEGAILVEGGWTNAVNNNVVLVDAPEPVRRDRLVKRDRLSEEEATMKIRRQISASERAAMLRERIAEHGWGRLWEIGDVTCKATVDGVAAEIAALAQSPAVPEAEAEW